MWERGGTETREVEIMNALFADDTSPIGKKRTMERSVRITKVVMKMFEEKNNEGKEERMEFGT